MNKLQELEQQRTQITYELSAVEHRQREQTLAGRQLAEIFHRAKEKLKQGTLESCREVVNTYVAQVIVYDDSIKISLRLTNGYHLEQSIKRDDVKSGM